MVSFRKSPDFSIIRESLKQAHGWLQFQGEVFWKLENKVLLQQQPFRDMVAATGGKGFINKPLVADDVLQTVDKVLKGVQ
jgi:hypothetical protein